MSPTPGIVGQTSTFISASGSGAPILPRGQQSGPTVFSPEVLKVLKKREILRLERNNKRDERRKAQEENVSDDEEDDLSPYIQVLGAAAAGANPLPPLGIFTPSQVPETPTVVSKLLLTDKNAAKNTFHANDNSIPAAIFSLAKNGISPPLTLFLPTSLDRIRSSNVKTVKHGTGETTKVTVLDISDFPDEATLDQATWFTCYNNFLVFLDSAAEGNIVQGFARHLNHILTDPAVAIWFPAYRAFDKQIRSQFFTEPYIVDINDPEYRAAMQSSKNSFLLSTQSSSPSSSGSPGHRGGGPAKEKGEHSKPYDKDGASHRKPLLCFRCGRTGHAAGRCPEKQPSKHGREFVIYANRDGLFRISDHRAVCMLFNCGRCDSPRVANHAIHICTLCGDSHHGATDCTRN
ncbi:hypothetical protein B0H16DRAFT_1328814 [Mycena metata]|uniref:CCHC-type domain-containing protein n=1 Tax=Mycena metata TaxID=1033252 RepID=A0AAD7I2B3_9AGAR|nr:hypothetical protein B0H16DRAFT_1328814 [Mycena metata]